MAPQQATGLDGSSLFRLVDSIKGTPDGNALSAHYHATEAKPGLEFAVGKARIDTVGQLADPRVKPIVPEKLKADAWWRS